MALFNVNTGLRVKNVRLHDLRHTFARHLQAAGVSFEDRQELLGHRSTGDDGSTARRS